MKFYILLFLAAVLILVPQSALAMSPQALDEAMKSDDSPTIIDVRPAAFYARSHIPGAINIPAQLCLQKNLPPLGEVVICGDGLILGEENQCLEALDARDGISAQQLEGGFSRWAAMGFPVTAKAGMQPEQLPLISYDMLTRAAEGNSDLLMVDLRQEGTGTRKGSVSQDGLPLTDLIALFPAIRIAQSSRKSAVPQFAPDAQDMLVLIDNGDGTAQAYGRRLRGAGIHRFVILVGGEESLRSRGQAGEGTLVTEIVK